MSFVASFLKRLNIRVECFEDIDDRNPSPIAASVVKHRIQLLLQLLNGWQLRVQGFRQRSN